MKLSLLTTKIFNDNWRVQSTFHGCNGAYGYGADDTTIILKLYGD